MLTAIARVLLSQHSYSTVYVHAPILVRLRGLASLWILGQIFFRGLDHTVWHVSESSGLFIVSAVWVRNREDLLRK